jgi:hypothetical protein
VSTYGRQRLCPPTVTAGEMQRRWSCRLAVSSIA